MSDTAVLEEVKTLRGEVAQLRWEMAELRRLVQGMPGVRAAPRSVEERRASLERLRELRERILAERGGVPLPPAAPEIAAMREERADEIWDLVVRAGRKRSE